MNAAVEVIQKLASHAGVFVPQFNVPRSTSTIRSWLKPMKTATVLSLLRSAEKAGVVERCGTGQENRKTWRDISASQSKENFWRLAKASGE